MFQRRRFNQEDGQFIREYAQKYNCSITEAINDRDEPMLEFELVEWFTVAAGRAPTTEEVQEMRPNSMDQINEQIAYYRE